MAKQIAYLDCETSIKDKTILDIGALREDGSVFHQKDIHGLSEFLAGVDYIAGHNILEHDIPCIERDMHAALGFQAIDTLYLSPLFFPSRSSHALGKQEKLLEEEPGNPVNDCHKAQRLLHASFSAFEKLPIYLRDIYFFLLSEKAEFHAFFECTEHWVDCDDAQEIQKRIGFVFRNRICLHADIRSMMQDFPMELAYALAFLWDADSSLVPSWLAFRFPYVQHILYLLRNVPCAQGCPYCQKSLDIHRALKKTFGFDHFRLFGNEPLQEKAVQAAVEGKSLLAVFPTGGGKSLAFQLPALMSAKANRSLTVVISPLQALMKDQVDNLNKQAIDSAVTINGSLDPMERANAMRLVENGHASLLYISPEQLRSKTIERLLLKRNVIRFVIDEAHCFSNWGQDFRIDYLFIADFIKKLEEARCYPEKIAVSCFTATAKAKVIEDIRRYFKDRLGIELALLATSATRENLRYEALPCASEEEKYRALRSLVATTEEPVIVYSSRTKKAERLAERLCRDGFAAKAFHGQMDPAQKISVQDSFLHNETQVIVATSAFGMGIDKKDIALVIHFDIPGSLEDYVQEAGRAGRNPAMNAKCVILYNDSDLDKHFILLNQAKLSFNEIQQAWKAIKELTKNRPVICCSPLEIARLAGWNESIHHVETKAKAAIGALEMAGYVKRGMNAPHVYATAIHSQSTVQATQAMASSGFFSIEEQETAKRIFAFMIAKSRRAVACNEEAESRIDYIADTLGIGIKDVLHAVNLMRIAGILDDSMDMNACMLDSDTPRKSMAALNRYAKLERFLFRKTFESNGFLSLKELNEQAQSEGMTYANLRSIRTLLYFLAIQDYARKEENRRNDTVRLQLCDDRSRLQRRQELRFALCSFIVERLHQLASKTPSNGSGRKNVCFSLLSLHKGYKESTGLFDKDVTLQDICEALLYLSKINAISLDGGFLVLYNPIQLTRLNLNNRSLYKKDDYLPLAEFYRHKKQMIHMAGEYARRLCEIPSSAIQYANDYFTLAQKPFIDKYFQGESRKMLDRNISSRKYSELFGALSPVQSAIIHDDSSRFIVVAAGPGSGKTFVLVHKLASLLLMEDVKCDQLLMLTFSRAAATEFKKRLHELVGPIAGYIDIKTFHSYCFDLLGKIGRLQDADKVIEEATEKITSGEIEPSKITKSVLVIDEAQDISSKEFALVEALIENNPSMRVIAVGDDDQNIFGFRGADAKYMQQLISRYGATVYEMTENHRSDKAIVALANAYASTIPHRMKTQPGVSLSEQEGTVAITRHESRQCIEALVNDAIARHGKQTACVLTATNEEALQAFSMLQQYGIQAKMLQDLDHFRLDALLEIRYFLHMLGEQDGLILPEAWQNAKDALSKRYARSTCLPNIQNMIRSFEEASDEKYMSDLVEFIRESDYEDFYDIEQETVYVSTIHKAKGRQFDQVYLLWNKATPSEEDRRGIYVAMTRAKSVLSIHSCSLAFQAFRLPGVTHFHDLASYPEPTEILVQLTHKDVYLDFFKERQNIAKRMQGGTRLAIGKNGLAVKAGDKLLDIVRYSKAFAEKLSALQEKGYVPRAAIARFIVAWTSKDTNEEYFIVLPQLRLVRPGTQ